ncbi:threonine synthase [Candidatus Nitrosocosmicus sp. SS]|uniref:threonine synthase n=1 Tax=Candidatus Nitrosocosmicus agrestis TaxID=2563600 RepID=UPI00122E7D91|nr:threonine synthase [Candidatus Nitrosocosmicus sp. SS]KAA2282667.1 threonine synthase [Candidatus Nitrosocosmicus sp. SS]KAF0867924.1 threonine synthase [Candidatus Nitrosocosmicus sp. SS]
MKLNTVKRCINPSCGMEYSIDNDIYRCKCSFLLDVIYPDIPDKNLIDVFYQRRNYAGNIFNESGVWRYRELLNFVGIDTEDINECSKYLVSLDGSEGRSSRPYQMSKVANYVDMPSENMLLQPEGYNPSGSFKDNGMSAAVTHAKLLSVKKIVCASTGNTSASAAMYASNEGLDCDVYIPRGEIAPGKLGQAFQFGAQVIEVDGNFDDALALSLENSSREGGYTVNSLNPFRIEGQKTIVFRIMEQLNWNPPDWIVYPGGALGNVSSCGKALIELYKWGWIKKVPRVVVVNAVGADTFYRLYNGHFDNIKLRWNDGKVDLDLIKRFYDHQDSNNYSPKTLATAIQIGKPANIVKALRTIDFTNGLVEAVEDKDMMDGMSVVGLNGFDCEMASGSVPAGILKLRKEEVIKKDHIVVGVLTGRQKDPSIAIKYHLEKSNMFAKPPRDL